MKVDRRFWLTFLHKRDREPIFDILKWRYFYASKLNRWKLEEDGKLLLEVELNREREKINVELFFIGKKVPVLRVFKGKPPSFEVESMLVKPLLEKVEPKLLETDDLLILSSGEIDCLISKCPWGLRFRNREGRIFFEEYIEGLSRHFFPVYPLGYKVVGGKRHFFESLALKPDEAIYGFGEKFGSLNKRGQNITVWNCDATHTSGDRSYKGFPFYMSTQGYGLLVKTGYKIVFEVGSEYAYNALCLETFQDGLECIIFYGPSFKEILKMYTELTGRAPTPPPWSFGLWMSRCMYTSRSQVEEVAAGLRELEIPCDVINIDPAWMRKGHYCDFIWDEEAFPKPEDMLKNLREKGFKVCLWEQPYVPKGTEMYMEGVKRNFFAKDENGEIISIPDFLRNEVAIVDFTNPEAKEWYKQKHIKLHKMGVSVFKCDMGDHVPEEAIFYNGKRGWEMHNLYPLYYVGTVYEAAMEHGLDGALVWGRPGYVGVQRYPIQWSGDPHSTFEDMACVLRGGLSYSLSGVPFWSHDIGGFQRGTWESQEKPSKALYVRWAQWGLLSSHSRCHGTTPREPWEYGEETLKIFRQYAKLRYSLLPYLYSYAVEASKTGLPLIRPLILEYQDDPAVRFIDSEYLLGPSLLVVPVFNAEGYVEYYLPDGVWLDWWTMKEVEGGRWFKSTMPLDKIPLFIREDSLIPRIKPQNYIGEKPIEEVDLDVWLKDRALLNYSFEGETFTIEADESDRGTVLRLGPSKRKWNIRFQRKDKVSEVEVEGGKLESWEYIEKKTCLVRLKPSKKRTTVRLKRS